MPYEKCKNIPKLEDHTVNEYFPENESFPAGKKVVLIGDSFSSAMILWVWAYSRQVMRLSNDPYYKIDFDTIDKFQPDVVIYETVERFLDRILLMK